MHKDIYKRYTSEHTRMCNANQSYMQYAVQQQEKQQGGGKRPLPAAHQQGAAGGRGKKSRVAQPQQMQVPVGYAVANGNGSYVAQQAPRPKPTEEGYASLMKSFTVAEIEAHLESLNESLHLTSSKIEEKVRVCEKRTSR